MPNANMLKNETSPYLLQHQDNPVHWQAWSEEALNEARAQNKPVLLSVGYAACHWCHVMAHESFEDPATAEVMNKHFVNIKVDREERPDLDTIYQTALAMMGQQGGWPLTMFLTPDGKPFWGGTYFPPDERYGRPSFRDVLASVSEIYHKEPHKVDQNVQALTEAFESQSRPSETMSFDFQLLDNASRELVRFIDPEWGGLQGAPKFPQPTLFEFMWRGYKRTGDEAVREAVRLTLDRMSEGGIYDHLGGGYCRYSTDEQWLVPHFEKMLYDNAQMVELLTLVWRTEPSDLYRRRVAETCEWVLREMMAEHGAFAATLDADSDGEEGKFYVWTEDEVDSLLDPDDARLFKVCYDFRPGGNWEGKTILNRNIGQEYQDRQVEERLARCREILFRERELRTHPGRDDKILADWNGMMIAALANAGFVFRHPAWIAAAEQAFAAIRDHMSLEGGRLGHSYRQGRLQQAAMLEDYAQMARAAVTLYEVTGQTSYLDQAEAWVETANRHYWDKEGSGYFMSADDAPDVIIRAKPAMDAAVPSGNGVMAEVLAKLWLITGKNVYRDYAEATIATFSGRLRDNFANMTSLLNAYEYLHRAIQVVLVGEPDSQDLHEMDRAVIESGLTTYVLSHVKPGTALPEGHPAHGKTVGGPVAYVCEGFTCQAPVHTGEELRNVLRRDY
ncbi:thioredoxin domain-containing protein [Telmatospirillum sp. J64-1]|uniref:thioredoxin domain-containing protein n=1 Tax=Telmatospirillum sp. J64-1 TaxID=2502183 RepID=UPI00115EB3CE|nr:thioredoxin domain-containing protein [Telmatospirillum sp. J64-1]